MAQIQGGTDEGARLKRIKDDPIMSGLLTRTPEEVYQWVGVNVTDLDSAKELLRRLSAAVAWLLQRER